LDCPDGELSILIVDDPQIAELNQQYLNRTGPTNVIAFPMKMENFSGVTPKLLGDVVISAETAERESRLSGISLELRMDQLLIHGILHLFDYDHEHSEQEAQVMAQKSDELLTLMNAKINKSKQGP